MTKSVARDGRGLSPGCRKEGLITGAGRGAYKQ